MNSPGDMASNNIQGAAVCLIALVMCLPALADGRRQGTIPGGGAWHVRQLPLSGSWHEGRIEYRHPSPLGRGFRFRRGYHAVYMAYVMPGVQYALGLRYPAGVKSKVQVMVFDRWPFDVKARRYDLPMGPVVRTGGRIVDYRWRIGVSPRSPGSQLFIVVETESPAGREARWFRHGIYLIDFPRRPMDLLGRGVTYLEGPGDLYLADGDLERQVVFVEPLDNAPEAGWQPRRGFIRNGDFSQGLEGWRLVSIKGPKEAARHVAVGSQGLRIWGGPKPVRSGVRQDLQRHVGDMEALFLRAEIRITSEGDLDDKENEYPLVLSVCYMDVSDEEYCGKNAFRRRFTSRQRGKQADADAIVVHVPRSSWHVFEYDLASLSPAPAVIRYITVEGAGLRGSEAWLRKLSLSAM